MIKGNKKIVSLLTSGILMLATNMAILSSDATITKAEEVKVAEVSLSDVSLRGAVTSKSTKTLSKDFATSKTTALAGEAANTKWLVKIQGNVLMQYTGMDGFTVNGGSKMIIEYK